MSTLAFVTLTMAAMADRGQGVYHPATGNAASWSINDHQTLIWDGKPYTPLGIRVDGSAAMIDTAHQVGIHDFLVDLPASGANWADTARRLDSGNDTYLLRVNSVAPMASGFAIDPSGYRVSGIAGSRHFDLELPGCSKAFVVVANRRDGEVLQRDLIDVPNGHFQYDVKAPSGLESILLIYPQMKSLEQVDYWEAFDEHRDQLLTSLNRKVLGRGLRGIVNPVGKAARTDSRDLRFVPTSAAFRSDFQAFLEKKYLSIDQAVTAWSMSASSFTTYAEVGKTKIPTMSFKELARLIPLWNGNRGVSLLWDPETDNTFRCDNKRSTIWSDLAELVNATSQRRFGRLVAAIHKVVDVPVVQEWNGWSPECETTSPSIDGIGMRASGPTPGDLVQSASFATSSLIRWKTTGWLPATDVDIPQDDLAIKDLPHVVDDIQALGAHAVFVRAEQPAMLAAVGAEAKRRAGDISYVEASPFPVFYPVNATNPAVSQQLAAGRWWLPCPNDGNRLDFGSDIFAYRMLDGSSNKTVVWAARPGRYILRLKNPRDVTVQTTDGSDAGTRIVRKGIELALSSYPTIISGTDEIPIPDTAVAEATAQYNAIVKAAERDRRDLTVYMITFEKAKTIFEENPGAGFAAMRLEIRKMSAYLTRTMWVEAESSRDHNLSDVINDQGCSGGAALTLRSNLDLGGYYAEYSVPVRTTDPADVWVAMKLPASRRNDFTIKVGTSQILKIEDGPVSLYGSGYGWYRLGRTRLSGNIAKLRVLLTGDASEEISIDAIYITPHPFKPRGAFEPLILP